MTWQLPPSTGCQSQLTGPDLFGKVSGNKSLNRSANKPQQHSSRFNAIVGTLGKWGR